jgi:ferredoxin-NADP reductase
VPKSVRVLVGLSDGQFTEVRSDALKEGDEVIVRQAR